MKNIDWTHLQYFAAVARAGSLTAASEELGSSPATVGRRMLVIEQAIGLPLFVRSQTGYKLTSDGRLLHEKSKAMDAGAQSIRDWLEADGRRSVVRISAGSWTTHFFATNFGKLWGSDDPFRIAFRTTEAKLDIAHREVDIGIRNARPESPSLAARRTVDIAYAPYRARNATVARDEWVISSPDAVPTPSARWVADQPGLVVGAWADTPRTLHDLIRAGVGKGVLPCFAGDRDPLLERAGDEIVALRSTQWIVMHNDDRQRVDIRAVIDRIVALATAHAPLFAGERPIGG